MKHGEVPRGQSCSILSAKKSKCEELVRMVYQPSTDYAWLLCGRAPRKGQDAGLSFPPKGVAGNALSVTCRVTEAVQGVRFVASEGRKCLDLVDGDDWLSADGARPSRCPQCHSVPSLSRTAEPPHLPSFQQVRAGPARVPLTEYHAPSPVKRLIRTGGCCFGLCTASSLKSRRARASGEGRVCSLGCWCFSGGRGCAVCGLELGCELRVRGAGVLVSASGGASQSRRDLRLLLFGPSAWITSVPSPIPFKPGRHRPTRAARRSGLLTETAFGPAIQQWLRAKRYRRVALGLQTRRDTRGRRCTGISR